MDTRKRGPHMLLRTCVLKYKDGTELNEEEKYEKTCFFTNDFVAFWKKLKENYADAVIFLFPTTEPKDFRTNSEEVIYVQHGDDQWAIHACDMEDFLKSNKNSSDMYGLCLAGTNDYIPWKSQKGN